MDKNKFYKLVHQEHVTKVKDIPKKIHQMWLDKKTETNQTFPEKYAKNGYVQTWKTHNPELEYVFWNVQKVNKLFQHPKLARWKDFYFKTLKVWIQKCDFARYALLYVHGGLYVDVDYVCFRNASELFTNRQIGLVFEPIEHKAPLFDRGLRLQNGIMASVPNHPFWEVVMDHIMKIHVPLFWLTMHITGPSMLFELEQKYNISETHPEWFWDPCKVLPVHRLHGIRLDCPPNSLDTAICATYWNEGTKWGTQNTKLSNQNANNIPTQSATVPKLQHYENRMIYVSDQTVYIWILFLLFVIMLCAIIFIAAKKC